MQYLRYSIAVMLLISLVSGCATILTGVEQELTFNSEPPGAIVIISGRIVGVTPLSVSINRTQNQIVTIEKAGYKKYVAQLPTTINYLFWGNILFGSPIRTFIAGMVDATSGAMYEFSPNQYFTILAPDESFDIATSREIKNLIIAFGSDLRFELASDGGQMTDTLLDMLGIRSDDEKYITMNVLNKLRCENENDLELAMAIIDVYDVQ